MGGIVANTRPSPAVVWLDQIPHVLDLRRGQQAATQGVLQPCPPQAEHFFMDRLAHIYFPTLERSPFFLQAVHLLFYFVILEQGFESDAPSHVFVRTFHGRAQWTTFLSSNCLSTTIRQKSRILCDEYLRTNWPHISRLSGKKMILKRWWILLHCFAEHVWRETRRLLRQKAVSLR